MKKLDYKNLTWSADWAQVFGAERPLILEIGFGYGHYLRHLVRQHPDANIIGLEISNTCLVKAEGAIARGELPDNVRVVYTMAETALHHLFEPESLSEIHINFPDPWFKNRHAIRRLIQRDSVDVMVNRLKPEGKLYLATDIIEYAEMSAEVFAETPGLDNTFLTPWVNEMPGRTTTKYEAKAAREGRICYYFAFTRNDNPAPNIPVVKEQPMPHMVFESPLSLDEMRQQFQQREITDGETHVNYLLVFQGDKSLLFETYIHEPTLEHRVALVLIDHETHYTLRLSMIGTPRPTEGIHIAVKHLGEWLVSLHPDAKVIQRKVKD